MNITKQGIIQSSGGCCMPGTASLVLVPPVVVQLQCYQFFSSLVFQVYWFGGYVGTCMCEQTTMPPLLYHLSFMLRTYYLCLLYLHDVIFSLCIMCCFYTFCVVHVLFIHTMYIVLFHSISAVHVLFMFA